MATSAHTYAQNCRLAPVSQPPPSSAFDDTPPIAAQFFYTSILPIDDPLSHGTLAGAPDAMFWKGRLRPFSRGDNNALESAWLSVISDEDGKVHREARKSMKAGQAASDGNPDKLADLVRYLATKHFNKHKGELSGQGTSAVDGALQPPTPTPACCPELALEVSTELQNTFCALARRHQSSLSLENTLQEIMMELRLLQARSASSDEPTTQHVELSPSSANAQATSSPTVGSPLTSIHGSAGKQTRSKLDHDAADSTCQTRLRSSSRVAEDQGRPRTPNSGSFPRPIPDDGISGTPFVRVGSLDSAQGSSSALASRLDQIEDTASTKPPSAGDVTAETLPGLRRVKEAAPTHRKATLDVVVGISRLHKVSIPALQMKPIYWSPVNDIAVVFRATWFYRDTMIPVPPEVANQLEAGYQELRPHTETWNDEIRCAVDIGPLGEEKVSHRLWPDEDEPASKDKLGIEDTEISTDPFCAARCFRGEAAAQGSIDPEPGSGAPGSRHRSFATYHVIYKDGSNAYLLKPSLKPSAYYGRGPVAKIMKGMTIGVPVVRGFDRDAWERLQEKKAASEDDPPQAATGITPDDMEASTCPACSARKDRAQVTDLILVCHGIGQKFAERVESFHFTHAINAFRREVNLELANPAVIGTLREDQNGIMVLPVNWRHTLSLEDGGPMTEEDKFAQGPEGFGLKDIEPNTIPAVRSMISDVMFDIPFYMSQHKGKMIEALTKEANRVYRLWCRNNPGFHENGRVHVIGHSLGSAMAVDILSRQPTRAPTLDMSMALPQSKHFEFDTKNLFLVGSPCAFFLLLERGALVPRRERIKPGADSTDVHARSVTGETGTFGCLAVDNIYNILAKEDPIAYLLNGTIDPVYAASLETAYVPSTAVSLFKHFSDTVRGIIPGAAPAVMYGNADAAGAAHKPSTVRLPSQLELEVHDFTREEIAERKAFLLNDNGQVDYYLRSAGGPLEMQYLNMLSAHSSYWANRDFIRMLCVEVGRKPGKSHTIPAMRAQKATRRVQGGSLS